MGIESGFLHRCTIQRATSAQDGYRQKASVWADYLTGVACRLVEKARTGVSTETAEAVTVSTYKLLLPAGTDVQIGDRVGEITLEDGRTMPKPFRIAALVHPRSRVVNHVSATLEEVS